METNFHDPSTISERSLSKQFLSDSLWLQGRVAVWMSSKLFQICMQRGCSCHRCSCWWWTLPWVHRGRWARLDGYILVDIVSTIYLDVLTCRNWIDNCLINFFVRCLRQDLRFASWVEKRFDIHLILCLERPCSNQIIECSLDWQYFRGRKILKVYLRAIR